LCNDLVVFRQDFGMVDELFEAEHLRSQGRFGFIAEGARLQVLGHSAEQGVEAKGHILNQYWGLEPASRRSFTVCQPTHRLQPL
jgi:hypothetical protein